MKISSDTLQRNSRVLPPPCFCLDLKCNVFCKSSVSTAHVDLDNGQTFEEWSRIMTISCQVLIIISPPHPSLPCTYVISERILPFLQDASDSSSIVSFVSTMELSPLAWRLKGTNLTKLAKLLGYDSTNLPKSTDPGSNEENILNLLTSWRDSQPIGSDIRGLLVEKLQAEFPEEKENLLRRTQLESTPSAMICLIIKNIISRVLKRSL